MSKNLIGKVVDAEGQALLEVFGPPNAMTEGDALSRLLYELSEVIIRGLLPDTPHGFLGGTFGYGPDFENDVFLMHHDGDYKNLDDPKDLGPDYPERFKQRGVDEDHPWRRYYDPPLFWHKASNFRVIWYKWIGRDMATNRDITGEELRQILTDCWNSLPQEARDKAIAEHEYENTPEYLAREEAQMVLILRAMQALDEAMRPCFKCSMDKNAQFVGGRTQTGGGVKINMVSLDDNGACSNCGHITTAEEYTQLAKRQKIIDASWKKCFEDMQEGDT